MTEHTPGPWGIAAGYDWVVKTQDGVNVAVLFAAGGGGEVREANGRLIAAAPDMKESLGELLVAAEAFMAAYHTNVIDEDLRIRLESAIAKARGK